MWPTGTQVACGGHHSLALSAAGLVYAWGNNAHGQLGIQTLSRVPLRPDKFASRTFSPNTEFGWKMANVFFYHSLPDPGSFFVFHQPTEFLTPFFHLFPPFLSPWIPPPLFHISSFFEDFFAD